MSFPSPSSDHPANERFDRMCLGCMQALCGLVLGEVIAFALLGSDPFGVVYFPIPQGATPEQAAAESAQWRASAGVIVGQLAMELLPLLASGFCGVFLHRSLPASIRSALIRMAGVSLLLLAVSKIGMSLIDRALSTGESSDVGTPLAQLAFQALCIALAAPLSSAVIRRRARAAGCETAADP